ncbi:hypothetical protein LTR53_011374 [Teratosphaeriaceae sp. CCFEE 6253]|nr:hypothetical protein LTR53_011374 [Teratosphaeriaceae sp. CCFEE 6253]
MATTNGAAGDRTLRILMLHGFTQSGHLFEIKTKALKKSLEKHFPAAPKPGHLAEYPGGLELAYPTAPIRLDPDDVVVSVSGATTSDTKTDDRPESESFGWWRRKGDAEPFTYEGMGRGFERIASVLQDQGPFDGVLGFSQGGAAAGMVASLLEDGRREAFERAQAKGGMRYPDSFVRDTGYIEEVAHPPLKFAVSYSGFGAATNSLYQAFYDPKITTPMLHFLGSVDTVVSEERSLRLVEACVGGKGGGDGKVSRVVYHPGGHFLPSSQKQYVAALVAFIQEVLSGGAGAAAGGKGKEERAEDMDLPF